MPQLEHKMFRVNLQNVRKNIQFIRKYYENVDFSIKNIYNYIVLGGI